MSVVTGFPFVAYRVPQDPGPGPRLAIIGEAPGAEEVRQGMPFVGRSGKLLDEALAAAGIERARCFVGNVFRYQPPGNKVGHFFRSRTRARREGEAIDERWGPFGTSDWVLARYSGEIEHLTGALAAFAPAAIVALGRTPLWALTGRGGIGQLRGQVLPCRLLEGVPVVPTFHPSFILRGQFAQQPTMVADLRLAAAQAAKA